MGTKFTIIDDGPRDQAGTAGFRATQVSAHIDGERVSIPAEEIESALGWHLRDEGLCRGEVCMPVRERSTLATANGIDLQNFARILDRPLAIDIAERAAVLGTDAGTRRGRLETLEAPDFELPDLQGRTHRLSNHRGKKVLLIAHASW